MREFIKKIEVKNRVFKKAYKSTYSKKIKWRIILPKEVYDKMIDTVTNHPPTFNFNDEKGLYILSLISSLPSYKKDKYYSGGYVNLNSTLLKKVVNNYNEYVTYFISNEILERNDSYSNSEKKKFSKSYRYNLKGIKNLTWKIFEFDVLKTLYDKIQLNEKAMSLEPKFLTKWIDSNLTIDSESSFIEIQNRLEFIQIKEQLTLKKAENHLRSLKNIIYNEYWASRNSNSDNRLHTNLSNMPKFFRKHLKYKEMPLAGIDIKNSQPFFLMVLLECIMNMDNVRCNKRIINKIKELGINGTMLLTLSKSLNTKGFQEEYQVIKKNILSGQFYDNLEHKFKFDRSINGKYLRRFYCKDSKRKPIFFFDTKRDVVKRLVLFFFYKANQDSEKKEDTDYLIFKKLYPKFCNVLEFFKEKNSKDLSKLLQHIEADCVIDYTCKKISEKYPEMPLFTIHDSIISTEDNIDILEIAVNKYLNEYCMGILPTLEPEYWCEECVELKTA